MLSAALLEVGGAATVSARLGESGCTIDLDKAGLTERQLAEAEDLVNAVIDDDAPIRAWFPAPGELAALKLRREPKVDDHIRVIAIGDFDRSPCGGTHCARTGQVGPVRVLAAERYKGGTRVTFAAGKRTRDVLGAHSDAIGALARAFSCQPGDVPATVEKLRRDLAEGREALKAAQRRWADALADRLLAGEGRVVAAIPGGDVDVLRALATKITAAGRDAVLAATNPDGTHVMIARAAGSTLDCGALLRSIAQACGGRGGGRADHAEGKLPAGVDWPALVDSV
jgi:alanyl-tRNA synthetase